MKQTRIIVIILFIFSCNTVLSQEDVSQYFDDGGIATASKLIKIGYDPINGELPLIFEHRLSESISVEWGSGLVFLKRQAKLYEDIQHSSAFGFNIWANLRIYLKGYYEQFYLGFQPRLNFLDSKTYTDIVFINCGYQRPINGKLVFDVNIGLGVRTYKEDNFIISTVVYEMGRTTAFYIPVEFKLGYAF